MQDQHSVDVQHAAALLWCKSVFVKRMFFEGIKANKKAWVLLQKEEWNKELRSAEDVVSKALSSFCTSKLATADIVPATADMVPMSCISPR